MFKWIILLLLLGGCCFPGEKPDSFSINILCVQTTDVVDVKADNTTVEIQMPGILKKEF